MLSSTSHSKNPNLPEPPETVFSKSPQISFASHAHPRPFLHRYFFEMQESPHALPLLQTLQHWERGTQFGWSFIGTGRGARATPV